MTKLDLEITFRKRGALRFISHLDLLRILEQAIRRSGLPVRFTEGFNPRVKLSSPRALPLGVESDCEVMVIGLSGPVDPEWAKSRLTDQLPEGLKVIRVGPPGAISRGADVVEEFEILFEDPSHEIDGRALSAFLAKETLPVVRETKGQMRSLDVRPMLRGLESRPGGLLLTVASVEKRHVRYREVLDLLRAEGIDVPLPTRVIKLRQFADPLPTDPS